MCQSCEMNEQAKDILGKEMTWTNNAWRPMYSSKIGCEGKREAV